MMFQQMTLHRGPVPEDIETFGERIVNLNLESVEGLFRGTVFGTDGSTALIFASDTMLTAIQNGTTFSMDSAFEVNIVSKYIINFNSKLTKRKIEI